MSLPGPERARRNHLRRLLVIFVAMAFVASACASGGDAPDSDLVQSSDRVQSNDLEQSSEAAVSADDSAPVDSTPVPEAATSNETDTDTTTVEVATPPPPSPTQVPPTPTASPSPTPTSAPVRDTAPNGRTAPVVAGTAAGLAAQIIEAETGLADPAATAAERADFGHLHQVAIRKLGYEPSWDTTVFEALPPDIRERTVFHVSARRALIDLSSGFDGVDFIPAWEIVEPESAPNLVSYYQGAGEATGIDWEFLAAINLVETGMGRIRGLSSAGAQGPMQFLPTTWDESGIGQGDINDPNDAINAAARYLVRRGGPTDMTSAIWGYNNSDAYVSAITAYAELLRRHPQAYEAIYNWEIYFFTEAGDVWLPTGIRYEETIDLADYLADNPWSIPDAGLR